MECRLRYFLSSAPVGTCGLPVLPVVESLVTVTRASSLGLDRGETLRGLGGVLLTLRTTWSYFFLTPTPRSSSLRRGGYIITAESVIWAAGG